MSEAIFMSGLTMRNKATLIAIPVVTAIAYLIVQSFFAEGDARKLFFTTEIATMKTVRRGRLLIAASRYRRREYMGIAWYLIGIDYFLLFVKDLLFGKVVHLPNLDPELASTLRVIFVIIGNTRLGDRLHHAARVWHVAGIALPGSRRLQFAAMIVGIGIAIAIVGWGTWQDIGHLRQGDKEACVAVASNLGDIVSFSAIAPILLTAIAMRGGALAWPWALVTLSNVGLAALRHVVELRAPVGALGARLCASSPSSGAGKAASWRSRRVSRSAGRSAPPREIKHHQARRCDGKRWVATARRSLSSGVGKRRSRASRVRLQRALYTRAPRERALHAAVRTHYDDRPLKTRSGTGLGSAGASCGMQGGWQRMPPSDHGPDAGSARRHALTEPARRTHSPDSRLIRRLGSSRTPASLTPALPPSSP